MEDSTDVRADTLISSSGCADDGPCRALPAPEPGHKRTGG